MARQQSFVYLQFCRVCGLALVIDAQPAISSQHHARLLVTCPNPCCAMRGYTFDSADYASVNLKDYGVVTSERQS